MTAVAEPLPRPSWWRASAGGPSAQTTTGAAPASEADRDCRWRRGVRNFRGRSLRRRCNVDQGGLGLPRRALRQRRLFRRLVLGELLIARFAPFWLRRLRRFFRRLLDDRLVRDWLVL